MNKLKTTHIGLASLLQTSTLVDQLLSTDSCENQSSEISLKNIVITVIRGWVNANSIRQIPFELRLFFY